MDSGLALLTVARAGDYVGLGLIRAVDPVWTPSLVLHFIIEDVELLLPSLQVEVSGDGYSWVRERSFSCRHVGSEGT